MIASKQKAKLIKQIERTKSIISKERDNLRDYLDDLESLHESCAVACDSLDSAIETLSQYL